VFRESGVQSRARTRLPIAIARDDGESPAGEGEVAESEFIACGVHDPQAFALLYRRYLSPFYRYCYHHLGSEEAAEDATSQVFAKALVALASYRVDRPFRSWLFAIAPNVIADVYRVRVTSSPLEAAVNGIGARPMRGWEIADAVVRFCVVMVVQAEVDLRAHGDYHPPPSHR
jgi:DNA-directed RNA polymerase specialized sigma24 family protein